MQTPSIPAKPKQKLVGGKYALSFLLCIVVGGLWMYFVPDFAEAFFRSHSNQWFGVAWYHSPNWASGTYDLLTVALPPLLFFGGAYFSIHKLETLNRTAVYQSNLKGLSQARVSLQQSLESIAKLESEFKLKVASFEALQKKVDDLASVKDLNVSDLQKKLNAIAHATRGKVLTDRIAAFVFGIVSSLLASYIWEVITK